MTTRDNYWTNDDGLAIGFGKNEPVSSGVASSGNTAGQYGEIAIDIVATELEVLATVVGAEGGGSYASAVKLPSGTAIISADLIVDTAFTEAGGGAGALLSAGTFSWNTKTGVLVEINSDDIVKSATTTEVATLGVISSPTAPLDGAIVGKAVNSADATHPVVIIPTYEAEVFTAGAARLIVKYKLA